ncbi:MAG: hypothetical protein GF418_16170, partial [Chitinivibrionales bacterium]|nr:hypothetical protein [Chitinivibrionales bacterium]MBD3397157.1 hypothetical protein [Chitinivibrionales bacterium]
CKSMHGRKRMVRAAWRVEMHDRILPRRIAGNIHPRPRRSLDWPRSSMYVFYRVRRWFHPGKGVIMHLRFALVSVLAVVLAGCGPRELTEEVIQKYPDGSKKAAIYYYGSRNNLRRVVMYYPGGNIQSEHFFTKGKSQWGRPAPSDILRALGIGASVFPDSTATVYYENGNKRKESTFSEGVRHGKEMSWFEDGQVKSEATFVKGVPQGTSVAYYEDGATASEVSYQDGKKDGVESLWYSNGNLKEQTTYAAGTRNGPYKEWWENGNPKKEENYTDGILDGQYTTYHENGKKQEEGAYKNGRLDGEKRAWNERGKLIAKAEYKDGDLESGQSY